MNRLELLEQMLLEAAQIETSNGRIVCYYHNGDSGRYVPFATVDEKLASNYPSIEGWVVGWTHKCYPTWDASTCHDSNEMWYTVSTPEGNIITT